MIDKIVITIACLSVGFIFGWYGNQINSSRKESKKLDKEIKILEAKLDVLQKSNEVNRE